MKNFESKGWLIQVVGVSNDGFKGVNNTKHSQSYYGNKQPTENDVKTQFSQYSKIIDYAIWETKELNTSESVITEGARSESTVTSKHHQLVKDWSKLENKTFYEANQQWDGLIR